MSDDKRPAFVYLLRCGDDSLYCGWTFNLEQRLEAHRAGRGARYTRSRLPVELAAVFEMPDAAGARREEARIKQLSRDEKLALIARPAGKASAREPLLRAPLSHSVGLHEERAPSDHAERRGS